jgi:tetratricopeptide (TPR) repeat protein
MNNLALAYKSIGKYEQAIPLYEQALEQMRAKWGAEHRDTFTAVGNLAAAYESAGAWDKAEPLRQREVERARQIAPETIQLAASLSAVAGCQLKQQKYSEAESNCRECLTIAEKVLPDNWRVFDTKSLLGEAMAGQKKFDDAEPLLIEGFDGMKQREVAIAATARNRLTEAMQRLVALYLAWGKPDEAARWTQKLKENP